MRRIGRTLCAEKNHAIVGRGGGWRMSLGRRDAKQLVLDEVAIGDRSERSLLGLPRAQMLAAAGRNSLRYGLVLVLVWIGGMKFTPYEAEGISLFVANSPLMSWAYSLVSVRSFSAFLGVTEISVALLIALRPVSPRLALLGSTSAVGMFCTTLSFLLTTPGVWETSAGGFPALSVVPGQFLVKDFVLLGAALWMCGDDWNVITDLRNQAGEYR
jgi:uncharacterized membrane protein YkgB